MKYTNKSFDKLTMTSCIVCTSITVCRMRRWSMQEIIYSTIVCWIIVSESIDHIIKLAIIVRIIEKHARFKITEHTHDLLKERNC